MTNKTACLTVVKVGVDQTVQSVAEKMCGLIVRPVHALARPQGFEPQPGDSESPMLPLHQGRMSDKKVLLDTLLSSKSLL